MCSFLFLSLLSALIAPSLQQTLSSVLSGHQNLSSFHDLLTGTLPHLLSTLEAATQAQPITILAPDNAAFAKIPYYSVVGPAWAAGDVGAQSNIMKYHVIPGDITSGSLTSTFEYLPTWLTNTSFTNVTGGQRIGAVMQAGAVKEMLFTSGESSRSIVKVADIAFNGGTLHIIDSLAIPPESFPETAEKFSSAAEPYQLTSFLGSTYSSKNNSLAYLLNTTSDITIFAPNNIALETVSNSLTSLSPSDLDTLLSYHIIVGSGGPFYSASFPNTTTLPTLNGGSLTISSADNSFFVNSARILTSDLLIAGGVMHVIDNVLSPGSGSAQPNPSLATQAPVLQTGAPDFNISAAPFTTYLPDLTENAVAAATSSGGGGCYGCDGGGDGAAATSSSYIPNNTPVASGGPLASSGVRQGYISQLLAFGIAGAAMFSCLV